MYGTPVKTSKLEISKNGYLKFERNFFYKAYRHKSKSPEEKLECINPQ